MGSGIAATVKNRLYADFFMPSRLGKFEQLLKSAIDNDYQTCSISQYWRMTDGGKISPRKKVLILRHDIDTDTATAEEMWNIEKLLSVKSTYYFRLSTLNIRFMQSIENYGSEASYHYEELSTICKHNKVRSLQEAQTQLPDARSLFARNIKSLRDKTGLPIKSVASHGDFINRKLGIRNVEILQDENFRKKVDIEVEAYDEPAMKFVESRHSDGPFPIFWKPSDPLSAIKNNVKVIYILVHPRHWRTAIKENLTDDIRRFYEQIKYMM